MTMIQRGNTIVFKHEDGAMDFYWLVDVRPKTFVFFDWYGNINRMQPKDFWEMSKDWFNERLADRTIEVYDSLPLDKYGDIFEKQAIERNNG